METNENIIKNFAKKGFLLDKDISEFFIKLADNDSGEAMLNHLFALTKQRVISRRLFELNLIEIRAFFVNNYPDKKQLLDSFFTVNPFLQKKAEIVIPNEKKSEFHPTVKILSSNIIPYKRIEVKDFVMHFKNRYNFFKDLMKDRKELDNLLSINKIGNNRSFSLIGLVYSKRVTKNKNIILEIEDLTGRINALISSDKKEIFDKAKEIVIDDIVGFKCSGNGEIVFINDIFFADCVIVDKKRTEE
jgi:DNA polymerase II small subunit/DNA polymerase delta subunit B